MSKLFFSIFILFFTTSIFAEQGTVMLFCESENVTVYVDGKKYMTTAEELTPLELEEGDHVIKVVEPINEQCQKYAQKEVYVSASSSTKVKMKFKNKLEPTPAYRKILDEKDSIKFQRFNRSKCEIVSDRKLGLMWQDSEIPNSTKRDLRGAKKYCSELEFSVFDDWRVPTYEELLTIVDYDRYDAAIVPVFKQSFSRNYWSSSQDVSAPDYAWVVNFKHGKTASTIKSRRHYVRCVREK